MRKPIDEETIRTPVDQDTFRPSWRLVKAGTPEWQALERAATEKRAPQLPDTVRLVKAADVTTCPKCGQARVVPGPAYDRGAWRCFGCGAGPKPPKRKRAK
jgi:hypothetical protein